MSTAKINKTDITISVGEKAQLKVSGTTVTPSWSVGNGSVVSVTSEGLVKGLKGGTTRVYAKVGEKTLECIVRVR